MKCREAVIAVVTFNDIENFRHILFTTTECQHSLEGLQGCRGIAKWYGTGEAIKGLHLLDRITLDGGSQALPNHPVEIHKYPCSQKPVNLVHTGSMPSGQVFDSRWFIGGIVVDMHVRVLLPALHHGRNKPLKY